MLYAVNDYSVTAEGKGWGPGWPTSRAADMARIETEITGVRVNVHRRISVLVKTLMDWDEALGYRYRQADTGGYNSRPIAGTTVPSNHSWGLALDGNWTDNPVSHDGIAHTDYTPEMVARWRRYGFAWGGAYSGSYRDAMHREFMGAPSDADTMTAAAVRDYAEVDPMAGITLDQIEAAARRAVRAELNLATPNGSTSWAASYPGLVANVQHLINLANASAAREGTIAAGITDARSAVLAAIAADPHTADWTDDQRAELAADVAARVAEIGVHIDPAELLDAAAARLAA